MIGKVTDPTKIVTDKLVLKQLAEQGIDKDFVEFWHDYAPRSKGKEYSPHAKFYRDLKSGKKIMAVSGLPKVSNAGFFIIPRFRQEGNKFISEENCFHAEINGETTRAVCVNDQPNGRKKGDWAEWHPQVFLDGAKQNCGNPLWLDTDPVNSGYHFNSIQWDFGFCKRRARIIEGRFRDRIFITEDPRGGELRVYNNHTGNMRLRFGSRDGEGFPIGRVEGDVEIISKEELAKAVYPVTIGASPETFYPDGGVNSVDGRVAQYDAGGGTWTAIQGGDGNVSSDAAENDIYVFIRSHATFERWIYLFRGIILFDTRGLPDVCDIIATTLSLNGQGLGDSASWGIAANIYSSAPLSTTALANGDYNSLDTTPFSDTAIAEVDWVLESYNHFLFNQDGRDAIEKDGISKFGFRESVYDVPNSPPSHPSSQQTAQIIGHSTENGGVERPKLVVTYTVATTPTVTAQAATDKEDTTATGNGNITNTGGENCTIRGIVWDLSTHLDPGGLAPGASAYANDIHTHGSFGTGAFTESLTGLPTGDTIYYRAYAYNSEGYDYSNTEISFLTKPAAPSNVVATDGFHTDKVEFMWTKSTGATGYRVYEGANLLDTLGDVATYDDSAAPAGVITPGTATAGDGDSTAHVTLSLAGESVANGAERTYKVVAFNATGDADDSNTDTGYRGTGSITYQWQRSDGDADSGYGNIGSATTDPYNDTGAPAPTITAGDSVATDGDHTNKIALSLSGTSNNVGDGRYYRCVVSATGTISGNSATDRGYRGAGSLTYQWQRSDGDSDANYNTNLGTASTYDDTGAPAPTITAGSATATDGLTAYVTLSLAGESANIGDGRYYQCVLAAAPAGGQTATANRGHRGVGSIVYKWQVSDADSDADYNTDITGGTTDPFNYEVTHIDGRYYRCYLTATGASADTSAVDRGWRKPLEVADGDLIGIPIIRKS